jgi:hypothetical protein
VFPLNLYARVRFFIYLCTRDRGCSAHPVFPAPSVFRGPMNLQTSGAVCRENADACSGCSPDERSDIRDFVSRISLRSCGLPAYAAARENYTLDGCCCENFIDFQYGWSVLKR